MIVAALFKALGIIAALALASMPWLMLNKAIKDYRTARFGFDRHFSMFMGGICLLLICVELAFLCDWMLGTMPCIERCLK